MTDLARIDAATVMRRGVLLLGGVTLAGTTLELAFLHHWDTALQAVVWPPVALLGVAFALLTVKPGRVGVRVARLLAVSVLAFAAVGIWFHVQENLTAGPLDRTVGPGWDSMSTLDQWWTAVTGGVGPAPTLAPGVLAEISLALGIATIRHPALEPRGNT